MQTDRHDGNPTSPTAWLTPNPSGSFPYGIGLKGWVARDAGRGRTCVGTAMRRTAPGPRFEFTRNGTRQRVRLPDPPWDGAWTPGNEPYVYLTASRSVLPALKEGTFAAAMVMLSPVRGLRP